MTRKIRIFLLVLIAVSSSLWIGYSFFNYFTYSTPPEIILHGLIKDGHYSNIIDCSIKADNSYKISDLIIFLDGKELEIKNSKNINKKNFQIPFRIDITDLSNDLHAIEIEAIDSSYHKNKSLEKWSFYVDNMSLKAAFLQPEYKVNQGRTVHVRIQANKHLEKAQIRFLENLYNCYPESDYSNIYECFIPVDCEQVSDEYIMTADLHDFVKNNIKLTGKVVISQVNFPSQKRHFNIPKGKLNEEKEVSMSNKIFEEALEKWLKDTPNKKLWSGPFEVPLDLKRIVTPFGEIRTTSEKGRYLHKAVDIVNLPKSVIWASQNGKVIIKDRFLMTGNTVAIDHGLGVITLYFHLEDFSDIEVGDYIKKGNPLGRMGMTGYADGYHLHWELRVNNVPVDPFEWTKKTF